LAQGGEQFVGGAGAPGAIEDAVAGLEQSRLARFKLDGVAGIGSTRRCSS
jgi:hypothetical protein